MNEKSKKEVFITNIIMYVFTTIFVAIYAMCVNGVLEEYLKISDKANDTAGKLITSFVPAIIKAVTDVILPFVIILMVLSLMFTLLGKFANKNNKKSFYVISLIPMVLLDVLFIMMFIKDITLFTVLPIGLSILIIISNIILFKKNKEVE